MRATITSKGQITIPKTIRDILNLKDKDEVDFHIQNGKVSFQKAKEDETATNIFDMLLEMNSKILVQGVIGHGKTFVIREAIERNGFQNILLREPYPQLEETLKEKRIVIPTDEECSDYLSGHHVKGTEDLDITIFDEVNQNKFKATSQNVFNHPIIMTTQFDISNSQDLSSYLSLPIIPDVIIKVEDLRISEIKKINKKNPFNKKFLYRSND